MGLKSKMNRSKKADEKQMLILLALLVLIFCVGSWYIVVPRFVEMGALNKTWKDKDNELKKISETIINKGMYMKKRRDIQTEIDLYEKKLPSKSEMPVFLGYLNKAAEEANIKVVALVPKSNETSQKGGEGVFSRRPIMVKLKCGYHELGRFLNKLETADRFIKIDDIEIKIDPNKWVYHNVVLVISTYVAIGS